MMTRHQLIVPLMLVAAALCGCGAKAAKPIILNDNAGWCWFQDERAIIHDGTLIAASIAHTDGPGGKERNANAEVTIHDLASGVTTIAVLHPRLLSADDHNTPAFLVLPDGRYLAVYAGHGHDRLMRWRISRPGDSSQWDDEKSIDVGASNTYSNLFRLSQENGRIYNFHRGIDWDPNYMLSDDDGASWRYGGRLLGGPGRPYLKYASNNADTIHFIATEQHPRDFDNSIYHGYLKAGKLHRSDGAPVGDLARGNQTSIAPADFTRVFAGDKNNVAWTVDMHLDAKGHPYIAFSVQKNQDDQDLRYHYARWDGARWNVHEIARAGSRLYHPENDYTGLVALHPYDPDTLYISTNVHPVSGEPLISSADGKRHYEIFRGSTRNGGKSWKWTAITANSTADNIRPIVPAGDPKRTVLLWLRGTYSTYTRYNLAMIGLIEVDR